MDFGKRLTSLRKSKKLTQQDIADKLNISRSAYAGYETGRRVPEYSTLEKMANLFDVSLDYLVARSNDMNLNAFSQSVIREKGPDYEMNRRLLEGLNKLSDVDKEYLMGLIERMPKKKE